MFTQWLIENLVLSLKDIIRRQYFIFRKNKRREKFDFELSESWHEISLKWEHIRDK